VDTLQSILPFIIHACFWFCGIVGTVALISPKSFSVVADVVGLWITPFPQTQSVANAPIDIDKFVMRNSRQFGALVLASVVYLAVFFSGRIDPSWTPPFLILVLSLSVIIALSSLVQLGGEVSKIEARLADARIDGLTGLANRRALDEELERRLSEKSRKGGGFCFAMFDIDHFKEVNDKYGHLTGDTVLAKSVGAVIHNTKRTMDLAARYGGDEFAIIYPASVLREAATAVENLRTAIASAPVCLEDSEVVVAVSIGVTEALDGDSVATLIGRADEALYAAKTAGRNRGFQHDGETCRAITDGEPIAATV